MAISISKVSSFMATLVRDSFLLCSRDDGFEVAWFTCLFFCFKVSELRGLRFLDLSL
jgi:hypothetical protein